MDVTKPGPTFPGTAGLAGRTFDAVLFDMDGTLIDSAPAVERSWVRWAKEQGLIDYRHADHGKPARSIVASLMGADRVEESLARIIEIETDDTGGIRALDGAAELLNTLPANRIAIVTSCTRGLADARLRAARLQPPPVLVTFDDITEGKPHPEGYLLAARRLGADPARCLVVEDAPVGLMAARAAGCATLAVTGTFPAHDLEADLVIPGLTGLRFLETGKGIRLSTGS